MSAPRDSAPRLTKEQRAILETVGARNGIVFVGSPAGTDKALARLVTLGLVEQMPCWFATDAGRAALRHRVTGAGIMAVLGGGPE